MISRYRTEKTSFDDDTAERVAAWLDVPLAALLIDMNAQRAKSERVKKAWASIAAVLALALLGTDQGMDLIAAVSDAAPSLYIMSNVALFLATLAGLLLVSHCHHKISRD
jgi:hypothetical protein